MSSEAVLLSVGSLVFVSATVVSYFAKVAEAKLTLEIKGLVIKLLAGIGLAVAAIAWGYQSGSIGAAVIAPAVLAAMLASMVLWLLTLRKTPVGDLKVKVGDKLLAFEATTSEGTPFHSDELAGKRILLKFFRGGW